MSETGDRSGVATAAAASRREVARLEARIAQLEAELARARQREQELAASEECFRQLAENLREVFWISDAREARLHYLSPAYETIWGRSRQSLYEAPLSFFDTILPEDRPRVQRAFDEQRRGRSTVAEYRVVRPDGSVRWIRDRAFPIRDAAGELCRVVGIAEDITETRDADQALRNSERRFRALIEKGWEAITLVDRDGVIVYAGPSSRDLWGYDAEEVLGRSGFDFIHPDDLPRVTALFHQLLAEPGGSTTAEYRVRHKDGSWRWTQSRGTNLLHEPGVGAVVVHSHDITERKQAEKERADLQAVTDTALAHLALGPLLEELLARIRRALDVDTVAVLLLEGHLLKPQAVYGFRGTEPAMFVRVGRGFAGRIAAAKAPLVVENLRRSPEVSPTLLECGMVSLLGVPLMVEGEVIGVLHVGSYSERSFSERDVRLLQLAADRAALAISRARLFAEVQEASRRKDEFLATLSHELRNPLAPIGAALEILRSTKDEAARARAEATLARQVEHLQRMVDDLLDVARVTRGAVELERRPTELAALLRHVVETHRPVIDRHGHELHVQVPSEPVMLFVDPFRIEQAVGNLLHNAAKFTPPGGRIDLIAELEPPEAPPAGGEPSGPGWVTIRVRDTGKGIPPEMLPRLFDLFTQVNPPLDRAEGGLGIGLTLVKSLVEGHGGRVEARSAGPGKGSEFLVRLPLPEEPLPAETPPEPEAAAPSLPEVARRVLVVDDNADAAETLAELLVSWGHEVRTAGSGPDGLAAAREFSPEIVLLDIGLPGMDGYELARRLREEAGSRPLRLIAVTGYGQDEDRQRSRQAGFDEHLVKPVDLDLLRSLLSRPLPSPE